MNEFIGIIIYNVVILSYVVYVFLISKRYFHMLQLNSYMNSRFINWFSKNIKKELVPFSYLYTPKIQEKKKFVFTNRVKRLYITLSLIMTLIIILMESLIINGKNYIFLTLAIIILTIVAELKIIFILLVNIVNIPIENLIIKWYQQDAKKILREHKNLTIIGITGSYGKTSSKYILTRILSEKFNVLMTPESYNTLIGVVKTIRLYLKPMHEIFIVEMGAKNVGDIKEIADFVKPEYGLLTSIGLQHLESFKKMENIISTKYELVDSLKENGVAFLNFDNKFISEKKANKNYISFGIENNSLNYWAENILYDERGLSFTLLSYKGDKIQLSTLLLGRHNVLNILGAVAIALQVGVEPERIQYAVKQLASVPHRLELKNQDSGVTIIDDAFNSNPEGAAEAIYVLGRFSHKKKILITPGMVELGVKEYECNVAFGKTAAKIADFIILVGTKRTQAIQEGLHEENYDPNKIYVAKTLSDALTKLKTITDNNSVVLFENDLPDNYEN